MELQRKGIYKLNMRSKTMPIFSQNIVNLDEESCTNGFKTAVHVLDKIFMTRRTSSSLPLLV